MLIVLCEHASHYTWLVTVHARERTGLLKIIYVKIYANPLKMKTGSGIWWTGNTADDQIWAMYDNLC